MTGFVDLFLFQYLSIFQFSYSDEHEKITSGVGQKLQPGFLVTGLISFHFVAVMKKQPKPVTTATKRQIPRSSVLGLLSHSRMRETSKNISPTRNIDHL